MRARAVRAGAIPSGIACLALACGGDAGPAPGPAFEGAGIRASVPGPLVGRFPADPADVRSGPFLEGAFGMAVGGGSVFVLDAMAGAVVHLDADGRLVARLGRRGPGPGELASPVGLELGPDGRVWVADPGSGRLSRFERDGSPAGDVRTPHPAVNFTVLQDGRPVIPTLNAGDLLAVLGGSGDSSPLAVLPRHVPSILSGGPEDRLSMRAILMARLAPDTLLLVRNRHATDFQAWTVALSAGADSILATDPLPLPRWLYTMIGEEAELFRRSVSEEYATGDFFVPLKSARVVDGQLWLAPGPSGRLIAVSVPRVPGDSVNVVLPTGEETEGMLDVAVVDGRLVALYATEVRMYELERVAASRFQEPG